MKNSANISPKQLKKEKTNIPGLDEILHGGLTKGFSYLVSGGTGAGKTILSLQWLLADFTKNDACMYITIAEPASELQANVDGFGWSLDNINILDLSPKKDYGKVEEYNVFTPEEVELTQIWETIYEAIEKDKPQKLVIDSVTFLRYLSTDEFQFRKHMLVFVNYLKTIGCTALLVYEPAEMEKDASLALSVDGIISLKRKITTSRIIELRTLEIEKLRGGGYLSGSHYYKITNQGIHIYPHKIEPSLSVPVAEELLPSGIHGLDVLLRGGIESGTCTLITGPTGVGKTSVGMQFLVEAAKNGKPSVLYSFEETMDFIMKRSEKIGIDLKPFIQTELIKIIYINPLELNPDEFLDKIRKRVEGGVKVLMLDSLRGYDIAMEQFGNIIAHVQNMSNYLKSNQITTIFINEIENITGNLKLTDFGVSHIFDNALLLRYAEIDGNILHIISCLKKRVGSFEPELRELKIIEGSGITVGDKLSDLQGVLSGLPTRNM